MVIVVGKDRRIIVDASVDAAALARVLQVWSADDSGRCRRAHCRTRTILVRWRR